MGYPHQSTIYTVKNKFNSLIILIVRAIIKIDLIDQGLSCEKDHGKINSDRMNYDLKTKPSGYS